MRTLARMSLSRIKTYYPTYCPTLSHTIIHDGIESFWILCHCFWGTAFNFTQQASWHQELPVPFGSWVCQPDEQKFHLCREKQALASACLLSKGGIWKSTGRETTYNYIYIYIYLYTYILPDMSVKVSYACVHLYLYSYSKIPADHHLLMQGATCS